MKSILFIILFFLPGCVPSPMSYSPQIAADPYAWKVQGENMIQAADAAIAGTRAALMETQSARIVQADQATQDQGKRNSEKTATIDEFNLRATIAAATETQQKSIGDSTSTVLALSRLAQRTSDIETQSANYLKITETAQMGLNEERKIKNNILNFAGITFLIILAVLCITMIPPVVKFVIVPWMDAKGQSAMRREMVIIFPDGSRAIWIDTRYYFQEELLELARMERRRELLNTNPIYDRDVIDQYAEPEEERNPTLRLLSDSIKLGDEIANGNILPGHRQLENFNADTWMDATEPLKKGRQIITETGKKTFIAHGQTVNKLYEKLLG